MQFKFNLQSLLTLKYLVVVLRTKDFCTACLADIYCSIRLVFLMCSKICSFGLQPFRKWTELKGQPQEEESLSPDGSFSCWLVWTALRNVIDLNMYSSTPLLTVGEYLILQQALTVPTADLRLWSGKVLCHVATSEYGIEIVISCHATCVHLICSLPQAPF